MSIMSNSRYEQEKARLAYEQIRKDLLNKECEAMNEMLNVLRNADHPMTAAQIEHACKSGISKFEIAGNLRAMERPSGSRYDHFGKVPNKDLEDRWRRKFADDGKVLVEVPHTVCGKGEVLTIRESVWRRVVLAEIDENGKAIPGTAVRVALREPNQYSIERV